MVTATPLPRRASTEKNFRHELVLDVKGTPKSYGYFDGEELEFGSESSEDVDPEEGPVFLGGQQTAGDLPLERSWLRLRDTPVYNELKPLRSRAYGHVNVFELDDIGEPISTTPTDILPCMLIAITKPGSRAAGKDGSKLKIVVKVKP